MSQEIGYHCYVRTCFQQKRCKGVPHLMRAYAFSTAFPEDLQETYAPFEIGSMPLFWNTCIRHFSPRLSSSESRFTRRARGHGSSAQPCSPHPIRVSHPAFGAAWLIATFSSPFSPPAASPGNGSDRRGAAPRSCRRCRSISTLRSHWRLMHSVNPSRACGLRHHVPIAAM